MIERGSNWTWRALFVAAGLVSMAGGALHPQAPDELPFQENLAAMMADETWIPGHALMTVGSALLLAGLLVLRQRKAWPEIGTALNFAVLATAVNTFELVFHTAAVADKDELRAGEWPVLSVIHLSMAVVAYPLFGVAIAWLAWRTLQSWPLLVRVLGVIGIVGGVAHALAAPLTILTRNPEFSFLFPIAGIGIALWLIVLGLVGLGRKDASEDARVPSPVSSDRP